MKRSGERVADAGDPDALVLRELRRAGADLTKPHRPEFAFYAFAKREADAIARELGALGYDVRLRRASDEDAAYEVVGSTTMVLDLVALRALTRQLAILARACGAEFDGWGAEVVT